MMIVAWMMWVNTENKKYKLQGEEGVTFLEGLLSSLISFTYSIVPGSPLTLSQLSVVTRNITAAILDPPPEFKTCIKNLYPDNYIQKK
jgi:hypothetical protein